MIDILRHKEDPLFPLYSAFSVSVSYKKFKTPQGVSGQ